MNSNRWQTVRVGDLIAEQKLVINDGYRVTNRELGPEGIPFVRGGDIGDGSICTEVTDHIRPEFQDRVTTKLTRPGDVAFISKGTVGRVGYLPRANIFSVAGLRSMLTRVARNEEWWDGGE